MLAKFWVVFSVAAYWWQIADAAKPEEDLSSGVLTPLEYDLLFDVALKDQVRAFSGWTKIKAYVRTVLKSLMKKRKFRVENISEDEYEEYYFKTIVFSSACTFRHPACVERSKAHFTKLINDGNLSADTDRYLHSILNPEKIAPRDRLTVFKSIASEGNRCDLLGTFSYNHVDELLKLHDDDPTQVSRYLEILYENTWTLWKLAELEEFVASNSLLKNIEMHLEEYKEVAKKNIEWLSRMKDEIRYFLMNLRSNY